MARRTKKKASSPKRRSQKTRIRRTDAQLILDLEKQITVLEGRLATREKFAPDKLMAHRDKLQLSAADYGELVGVSGLTIYNWEKGKTRPRKAQLESWLGIRKMKPREAWEILGID